jgi:hypothetical protein
MMNPPSRGSHINFFGIEIESLLDTDVSDRPSQADIKSRIHELVERLEAMNPQPKPLEDELLVSGNWTVLYSTIRITVRYA